MEVTAASTAVYITLYILSIAAVLWPVFVFKYCGGVEAIRRKTAKRVLERCNTPEDAVVIQPTTKKISMSTIPVNCIWIICLILVSKSFAIKLNYLVAMACINFVVGFFDFIWVTGPVFYCAIAIDAEKIFLSHNVLWSNDFIKRNVASYIRTKKCNAIDNTHCIIACVLQNGKIIEVRGIFGTVDVAQKLSSCGIETKSE